MSKEHIVKMIGDFGSGLYFKEGRRGKDIPAPRLIKGELGVLFEGEDFIPYGDLGFNSELGFYKLSSFPEYKNEALLFAEEGPILSLGQIVIPRGIEDRIKKEGLEIPYLKEFITRYALGYWGSSGYWRDTEVTDKELRGGALETAEDNKLNFINTLSGINRIIASYITKLGKIWIITEADRSVTTILKPEEY